MESVLKIEHIEKYYGNRGSLTKAVDDISFDVEKQEFVAIMGASGSGKTTLLNCISTIDRVTSGHIYMNGKEITKLKGNALNRFRREELGFIFQDFNLLDTLTAYENIALALTIQGKKAKDIEKQVKGIAKKLNITDVLVYKDKIEKIPAGLMKYFNNLKEVYDDLKEKLSFNQSLLEVERIILLMEKDYQLYPFESFVSELKIHYSKEYFILMKLLEIVMKDCQEAKLGRETVKLTLSLMMNQKLRLKIFGF